MLPDRGAREEVSATPELPRARAQDAVHRSDEIRVAKQPGELPQHFQWVGDQESVVLQAKFGRAPMDPDTRTCSRMVRRGDAHVQGRLQRVSRHRSSRSRIDAPGLDTRQMESYPAICRRRKSDPHESSSGRMAEHHTGEHLRL